MLTTTTMRKLQSIDALIPKIPTRITSATETEHAPGRGSVKEPPDDLHPNKLLKSNKNTKASFFCSPLLRDSQEKSEFLFEQTNVSSKP